MSKYRRRMPMKKNKRMFRRTASKLHKKNAGYSMRGGIRL